ncbi:HEAT repeat-containing 1 [Solea senegalensis]|uniref:HEAT repeat-containing protein 1 n=1 Tax=Solea senegalensis TaxID=28829 RepID=A0AAV6PP17_SOLSE|nr:HEAT repeat-containing protein 1 [Solea senegalensis]KAG7470408.1 HEAT repeat-containing 1 [Solea senegalensis]
MTSLAHQLKRLALPQSDPDLLTRSEVVSLLFDPKDAATMDRTTFYALGCTGLEELLGIEPLFLEFQDTLFSRASLTLERSVQSKDVNAKLDAGISLFLARLSPYFLIKPAHKCLEWLIHRFHVHLYNTDALLACVLPYHDTKVFVRVLQLLKIGDSTHRWNWLHCLQKAGVPLSRAALVTHCYTDLSFMDFICTLVTRSIQAYSGHSESCPQLRVIFSFYASTVVSALDAVDSVSDAIIAKLLPFVQRGLKSSLSDYKAASYMLVCELSVKVLMDQGLVDSLSVHVCRSLVKDPVLAKEGLGCLIVLLQHQKEGAAGHRALSQLCSMPALVSTLQVMATVHDVSPLLIRLLPYLIHRVFTCSSGETDELALLDSVLKTVPLTGGLDQTMARLLLLEYLSQTDVSAEKDRRLLPVVRLFESRYSGALDAVLAGHVTDLSSPEHKRLFHHFLLLSVSSGKFQIVDDMDTSLFLSLKHPLPSVRVSAVEHLMGVVSSQQSLDMPFLKDAVTDRLNDDVPEVVAAALKVLEELFDVLEPEHTETCLLSLMHREDVCVSEQWLPVLKEAVRLLSDPRLGKGGAVGWKLLPFLVISDARPDSAQLRLAACVARSSVLAQHPLTVTWAKEMEQLVKKSCVRDFVGVVNERLVSTLTNNLANMEHFSKREALEKLALLVEEQRGSALRDRMSFLVLTQTLLLSLGELSGTQHLLTAHRLYTLLERPLLELISTEADAQEVECPVSAPSSFPEALTLLVNGCERRGYVYALMTLLRQFISFLKCHDTSFKGDSWWNPEKMDTNSCCYLGLLCRVFSVVASGAADGTTASSFRPLMKLLFQVHLCEPLMLFRFLCLLWGYGGNHDDQLDVKVDAVLQTRTLRMGGAILRVQTLATLEELSAADSPVIPSLLSCLSSPLRDVRRSAVAALQSFSGVASSLYQPITEKLLMTSEEIIADPAYLSTALAVLDDETSSSKVGTRRETLQASMQQLLQSVHTSRCPSYSATALLRALSLVNGESVLSGLLPLLDRLLEQSPDTPALLRSEAQLAQLVLAKFNETSAGLLTKDQTSLDLFVRALKTSTQLHPEVPSCQISALEQITKSFFSALGDEKVQQKLLTVMFDLLLENQSPLVANTINSVFKGISVDGQLVANELSPPERPRGTETVQQTRRSKMSLRKPQDGGEVFQEGGAVPWQRVTLILELLQHKKKLKRGHTLVPVLFSLLSRSLEASSEDHMEYTKQLLLSCLLNICRRLSPEGGAPPPDVLEEDKFSVELVVQCIRATDVPQTHHHALLLLATAAAIFPEKVLHNIMPIFTFMGANILRLDDVYSFRVIDKTVQMVIPALIKAHPLPDGQSSSHVLAVVTKIMHVFADALPHVPDHRRLPILAQLVTTLGPAHFLWVLMLLLFKLHAVQAASSTSERDVGEDTELWVSVCCHFEVSDVITTIIRVLKFLQQLPHDDHHTPLKRSVGRRGAKKKGEEHEEELIFSVDAHSSKELRHFMFLSVSFAAQLLGSDAFIAKVADGGDVMDEHLQQQQQRLLEEILRHIHSVACGVEVNADKPSAKFWRVLLNKSYDVLDKVNALLPTDTFITVMKGLMGNQLSSVRRKAMELLNNKLQRTTAVTFDLQQVDMLLQLTPDLLSIVGKGHAWVSQQEAEQENEAEQAINRQTALYSLKLLCRKFGADHQEAFVPVLLQTVDIIASEDEDKNVMGSALLCTAEVLAALKALAIPQLPRLVPAVLHTLKDRKQLLTNEVYLLSAVTALHRVTETLPHFISPYLQDIAVQVCRLTRLVENSSSSSLSSSFVQLSLRLVSLRKTLATQLPPRVLLPALSRCYSDMVVDKKAQLGALMSMLKDHITHMEKDQLSFHQSELTSFFLTALDFRAQHCQGDLERTSEVEGHVIDCLLAMVMKLSEVTFRPLFFKLFDWSKSDSRDRLLTFYRLSDCVAERLKGLFVLFAGNLVTAFSDVLRQKHSATSDLSQVDEQKTSLLLQFVLDCLYKIFLYDSQRFLSKERADALLCPLVDQLENMVGGQEVYQQRVVKHLVPCVGQFSVALADDSEWKTLNYQILLKTRHSNAKVRFAALLMLKELASKLKENYVILLPESVPFMAELMEDECEEVEQQVHKVIQEMENILGEPLQSYF